MQEVRGAREKREVREAGDKQTAQREALCAVPYSDICPARAVARRWGWPVPLPPGRNRFARKLAGWETPGGGKCGEGGKRGKSGERRAAGSKTERPERQNAPGGAGNAGRREAKQKGRSGKTHRAGQETPGGGKREEDTGAGNAGRREMQEVRGAREMGGRHRAGSAAPVYLTMEPPPFPREAACPIKQAPPAARRNRK